jgi:hypothetical protein
MIFAVLPDVSDVDQQDATAVLDAAFEEWADIPAVRVGAAGLVTCDPGPHDALLFFNSPRAEYARALDSVLERALAANAVVVPIAISADASRPPEAVTGRPSFDVEEQLRRRELASDQLALAGAALARETLALTLPTFTQQRLRVFVSYRRSEAADAAQQLALALSARHANVFSGFDVPAGLEVSEALERGLAGADAVVLLDTPNASSSEWIHYEILTALGRGIPVVWVRFGDRPHTQGEIAPADVPHVVVPEHTLSRARADDVAERVMAAVTRLALRQVRTSQHALADLREWAHERGGEVLTLDERMRIFEVVPPSRGPGDVVQFFGRAATAEDADALQAFVRASNRRGAGRVLALDPTERRERRIGAIEAVHPAAYVDSLISRRPASDGPGLLLFGAFATSDYAQDQIVPAVQAVATTWFSVGGRLVCGGYPPFVRHLTEAAQRVVGAAAREALDVYLSEYFADPEELAELRESFTVIATPRLQTRAASLRLMRERMIRESQVVAAVAIGGRMQERDGSPSGIEEEVGLAREHGLPVYLLGAPGGQAARLAEAEAAKPVPWSGLGNHLGAAGNEMLRSTERYEAALRLIWDHWI